MKNNIIFILISFFIFQACGQAKRDIEETNNELAISVYNTLAIERENETVVVDRATLTELIGNLPEGKKPYLQDSEQTHWAPSQTDDLDGDGQWDELAFSVNIAANSVQNLFVKFPEGDEIPTFPRTTNVRLGQKKMKEDSVFQDLTKEMRAEGHTQKNPVGGYQMEGPGWENNKVGFRLYFDPRNGKDIFGKVTSEMVMDDKVGIVGNYHDMQDWGMDILKVGNSLGAGALAIALGDSLYPLTGAEEVEFEILAEGPARAVFELRYKNWPVEGNNLQLTERISIWKGQYWYKSEVFLQGAPADAQIVTGIVNLQSEAMFPLNGEKAQGIATYDAQAYGGENLGMAILTAKESVMATGQTAEAKEGSGIVETFFVKLSQDQPISFRFFAAWQLSDERFKTEAEFKEFMEVETKKMDSPVIVKKAEVAV